MPRSFRRGRTVAYPLPGHFPWASSSSELDRLLRPTRLADAYAAALQRDFAGKPVNLVGHSSGGFISLLIAARHPRKVKSIIIVSGFADGTAAQMQPMIERGLNSPSTAPLLFQGLLNLWTANPTTFRSGMANLFSHWNKATSCPNFDEICERVRQDLRQSNTERLLRVVNWLRRARNWHYLPDVTQKVCVIAGNEDRVVPFAHQKSMAARLRKSTFVPMRHTGHLPMVEDHAAFTHAIDRWA